MTLQFARKVLAQSQRVEEAGRRLLPAEVAQVRQAVCVVAKHNRK